MALINEKWFNPLIRYPFLPGYLRRRWPAACKLLHKHLVCLQQYIQNDEAFKKEISSERQK